MKAAVFLGNRRFTVTEDRDSEPGAGEVLVRLEGCGVSASTLPMWQGRPWFDYPLDAGSPGHELRAAALAQGAVATRPLHADSADRSRWPRVIECTGTQEGLDLATALAAPGARIVLAGYHQDGLRTVDMQDWNWKGIDVVNAQERDRAVVLRGIHSAIAAIEERRLDPWPLMSHRFGIDELDQAFHVLESRPDGFIKGYLAL